MWAMEMCRGCKVCLIPSWTFAEISTPRLALQNELSRNHCRPQRIDIWQQAVDTDVFNPAFRSEAMRARMSGGKPDSVILTYVGRLGAGV